VAIETFGYSEVTLDDLTLSTVALVDLDAELTATLDALTSEAVIAWNFEGALTATLDALTLGSVNISGVDASVTATLGALTLQAVESGPPWPVQYDFPQSPLDGTWRRERGDDTLRSDRAVGARQYRTQNGGNYADATFAIMVKSKSCARPARPLLPRRLQERGEALLLDRPRDRRQHGLALGGASADPARCT
jgi:hypothetical protein